MRRASTTLILTALTAAASFAAEPQTATITAGDAQLNLRFGAAYVDMSVANGLGTAINEGDFTFITQAEHGSAISATGFLLGADYWGQGLGDGGFYLGAGLLNVNDNNGFTTTLPASGFLDLLPIDGRTSPGLLISGGATAEFATTTSFHRFEAAAGYALPDMADGTNLALGLYGAQSHLTLDATITTTPAGTTLLLSTLSEQVTTLSIGPMVAFQHTTALSDTLDGFVEAQAALLYASGLLEAHQSAIRLPTDIALSSQTGNLAGMLDIRAGVTTSFGDGKLTLFGGLGLRNDVYSVTNPRSSDGLVASNGTSYHPGPATLQQTMQVSASVGARFVLKF